MCDQDLESFIGHVGKLFCLRPEILCVRVWLIYRYTVMTDLSKDMWNLALRPLKASYLHYHNAYGNQA